MKGWIKVHRQIRNHWVFQNEVYFRAWVTILLEVNHVENKVLIGSTIFEVEPGQSLNSLDTWVKEFGKGWTKQKVRTFFSLLEKDNMINTINEKKTTRLTVCNYETYQTQQHDDNTDSNTQATRKQHASNTLITSNKNDKNDKNDKNVKKNYLDTITLSDEEYKKLLEKYKCQYDLDQAMAILNNYKASKGKRYKSDYHVMIGWVFDRYCEDLAKSGMRLGDHLL